MELVKNPVYQNVMRALLDEATKELVDAAFDASDNARVLALRDKLRAIGDVVGQIESEATSAKIDEEHARRRQAAIDTNGEGN